MRVDFQRLEWENYPSKETPLHADNLNRLEEGVAGLYSDFKDQVEDTLIPAVEDLEGDVSDLEEAIENVKPGRFLTQAEYDLLSHEEKNNGMVYYIKDAPGGLIIASDAAYNNTTSGLAATNVQQAIDELLAEINALKSNRVLLWTNTGSELGATEIQLPTLSQYPYIEIEFCCIVGNDALDIARFKNENGKTGHLITGALNRDTVVSGNSVAWMNFMTRLFTIGTSSITFQSGQMQYAGNVYKDWNGRCVPVAIYGLVRC